MSLRRKRFWTDAEVLTAPEGFGVALDGKPVTTPAKAPLVLPTGALAEAVAAEWRSVGDEIEPSAMPLMRLANSTIDKVRADRSGIARMLGGYGDTDLVCYRAAEPAALVARQSQAWDPLLEWVDGRFGVPLRVVTGVMYRAQDSEPLRVLHGYLQELDDFALMAVHDLVGLSGSLVIGLAVHDGHISAETAWALSRVDETWQAERWGEDAGAAAAAADKRRDFDAAGDFLTLSRL